MNKTQALQDLFLNQVRKDNIAVTIDAYQLLSTVAGTSYDVVAHPTGVSSIRATWYGRTRNVLRTDTDNLIASLKAHCDGLADAGIVANDRGFVWAADPITRAVDKDNPKVVFEVEELP